MFLFRCTCFLALLAFHITSHPLLNFHLSRGVHLNHGWESPHNMMIFACNRTMKVELLGNLSIPEVVQTSNANFFCTHIRFIPKQINHHPDTKTLRPQKLNARIP